MACSGVSVQLSAISLQGGPPPDLVLSRCEWFNGLCASALRDLGNLNHGCQRRQTPASSGWPIEKPTWTPRLCAWPKCNSSCVIRTDGRARTRISSGSALLRAMALPSPMMLPGVAFRSPPAARDGVQSWHCGRFLGNEGMRLPIVEPPPESFRPVLADSFAVTVASTKQRSEQKTDGRAPGRRHREHLSGKAGR